MSVSTASGTLSITTGALGTTFTVSGLLFQPKAVKVAWSGRAAAGETETNHRFGNGFFISTTERRCHTTYSLHANAGTTAAFEANYNDACVVVVGSGGLSDGKADVNSITADGFQLIIDEVFTTGVIIEWMAYGDADITDVAIVDITEPASTGGQNIAVPFPLNTGLDDKAVIFIGGSRAAFGTSIGGSGWTFGVAAGHIPVNGVCTAGARGAQADSSTFGYGRSGECIAALLVGVPTSRAFVTSWLTTGFMLNWTEVDPATTWVYSALVIKGGRWQVGFGLTSTGLTNQFEPTTYIPKGLLIGSVCRPESTSDTATVEDQRLIGMATSPSVESYAALIDKNAQATTDMAPAFGTGQCYANLSNAATIAIEGTFGIVSFDATPGFTFVHAVADPIASWFFYLLAADAPGAGGITADAAITEAPDTIAATGDVAGNIISGTAAITEAPDTVAAAATTFTEPPPGPGDPVDFVTFVSDPVVEQCYVASLMLLTGTPSFTGAVGPRGSSPIGQAPIGASWDEAVGAGVSDVGFSSVGYTSKPADTPSNTHYESRLIQPISFGRGVEDNDRLSGLMDLRGEAEIGNADGALDTLFDQFAADGRTFRIRAGREVDPLSVFGEVFTGTIANYEALIDRLTLSISDGMVNLNKPIQTDLYTGTGGLGGGPELEGMPRPLCFGNVKNISPPLIDAGLLMYQVHGGPTHFIPDVYDSGIPLNRVAEYPVPTLGQYSVNLGTGTFKLGGTPAGAVTANVNGSNQPTYFNRIQDMIKRVLVTYGGVPEAQLVASGFAQVVPPANYEAGLWIGTEPAMIPEVLAQLISSVGGYGGFNRNGLFEFGILREASGSPAFEFTTENIMKDGLERIPLPPSMDPIVWRTRVAFGHNYTKQDDLLPGATWAQKEFASQPDRFAISENYGLKSQHLLAQEMVVPSLFVNQADAKAESLRLFNLFSVPRALYRIKTSMMGLLCGFGATVRVTYPRYSLSAGKLGVVVGQRFDASRSETEITVFV